MSLAGNRPRVVVLGAGGFIGGHLLQRLESSGRFQVRGAARGCVSPGRDDDMRFDLSDVSSIRRVIGDVDVVVNCTKGDRRTIEAGTAALIDACSSAGRPPRFIHLSSMSVYGDVTGRVDEAHALAEHGNWYVKAKVSSDRAVGAWGAGGHPVLILRPGVVIGSGDHHWTHRLPRLVMRGSLGNLGDAGSGGANLLHVDDLTAVIESCLSMDQWQSSVLNVAAPGYGTWNDVFGTIAACCPRAPDRRVGRIKLLWESRARAPVVLLAERLSRSTPFGRPKGDPPTVLTPSMTRLFASNIDLDTTKLTAMVDVPWVPPRVALAQATRWALSNGSA
jgi:nucleoside-diphosphate-sugar epimerase